MGLAKNQQHEERSKNSKRGSVNNNRRLEAFKGRTGNGNADWGGCSCGKIQDVVTRITELGGAVTFGLSRDQGAHSLTLMLDSERQSLWFNGDADLDEELDGVLAILGAM